MKIQVVYYSKYGHLHLMAEAIAKGARTVPGAEVSLWRVPEIIPEDAAKSGCAKSAHPAFSRVPFIEPRQLAEADAILFGTPTRFGNMSAPMRHFLDQTGKLWMDGSLIGKVGSAFTSTATQHGGQESTLLSFHTTLLHHGMMVVGLPYSEQRQMIMSEISGGTPYGASTITAPDGSRKPSENELAMARFQGHHVAQITASLVRGRMPAPRAHASNCANYGASA